MICWAKSSAQPTTPAASTGAAGTTYQGYKTRKLAMYEFQGSSKWHKQCVQTWPIPTSRLIKSLETHRDWEFHLPTQPVCMLRLHLLLQKISENQLLYNSQESRIKHSSDISDALKFKHWNGGSNESCEAFDITSRHSQGTPATGEPFLLEKQVDRAV